ncbi:MAG: alpha/beta fold hydrolase [Propionibacteriaceae bacterium]
MSTDGVAGAAEGGRHQNTAVQVRRVEHADTYVRVSTIGPAGERAFVLVPGIGVSSNYFLRLAPDLNGYGPVHALDLPGFGGVPHPARVLGIPDFAELVGRTIDELGLVDPILVGHSMGTQVVVELATARPQLSTVVLIGPVVNAAERHVLQQAWRFAQSARHEPGRVKALVLSAYVVCGPRWFSRVLPQMMRYRIEDRVSRVESQVLIIRGEHDANCTRAWAVDLAERLPRSKVWEVPDAAHSVMYAHAREVAQLCVRYARHPTTDDDRVHVVRQAQVSGSAEPKPTFGSRLRRTVGRLRELWGIVRGDDHDIARGRTEQAEAQQGPTDPPE